MSSSEGHAEHRGGPADQAITRFVAEFVVDDLEPVDVDHDDADGDASRVEPRSLGVEEGPVVEPRERVVRAEVHELLLELLAVRDVAHEGHDEAPLRNLDVTEGDLDGDRGARLLAAEQGEALAHRTHPEGIGEPPATLLVLLAHVVGNEELDRSAEELVALVAEEPLRHAVHEDHRTVGRDHDDRVRRRLDQGGRECRGKRCVGLGFGAHSPDLPKNATTRP